MKTVFLRVLDAEDKAAALLHAVREPTRPHSRRRFDVDATSFASVPRSPFAYWVGDRLRGLFADRSRKQRLLTRAGMQTCDDFRFVRLAFEVPTHALCSGRWRVFAKGGAHSPFYAGLVLVVTWGEAQTELEAFGEIKGNAARSRQSSEHYFRPGLTWPSRTNGLSLRAMPAGCIFGHKGPSAFVENDDGDDLLALASVTNSRAFGLLVSLQLARTELAQSYEVGLIEATPIPRLADADRHALARLARRAWSLKRCLDTRTATSHAFTLPALLQVAGADVVTRAAAWSEHLRAVEAELAGIQADIDERCFALYGIDEADRRAITEGFDGDAAEAQSSGNADESEDDAGEESEEDDSAADSATLAAELVSWAVSVAFGRFDVRLATRARSSPVEPEPFDPLPVCSPGMLTDDDGLPTASAPAGYPLSFPADGVLVDDLGHARDLTTAVRAVFDVVVGPDADARWHEVAELLDSKTPDTRHWISKSYFEIHLKQYSKSRRKAPIYWQIATSSASYSVWLYAHRMTKDSLLDVLKFVEQKLRHEDGKLASLRQTAGPNPTAGQRKEIAAQEAFVEELRALLDEVARVAPLWNPDLNDGVVLTMAPLWRLVPQHRAWQKELKAACDALCDGKYDWAHVAMHLWPERVVPKCATDRSLAIAHDLEDVFWEEAAEGKWRARQKPTRTVEELARERTSPAVKAALKSLIEAPVPGGGAKRGRRAKAADDAGDLF